MITLLVELLRGWGIEFGFFRLIEYPSFRAIMGMVTSLGLSVVFGWRVVVALYRKRFRDTSGEFLSISAHSKQGTPTGGGVLILLSCVVAALLWGDLASVHLSVLLGGFVYLGMVGYLDDARKVRFKSSLHGLGQLAKTALLLGFVVPFTAFLVSSLSPLPEELRTVVTVPFVKRPLLDLGEVGFFVFAAVAIFAIINAINVTDGMDGLLSGISALVVAVYVVFAYVLGRAVLAAYLLFPRLDGAEEIAVFGATLVGSILGFLWFNSYPAEVFMGDTGSLSIGGAIAMMAFLLKQEMLFPIVGGVFVLEIFTSLVQEKVGDRLARRIVHRAPFHYAVAHRGVAEPKVVVRLWIVSLLLALVALLSLKVR